MPQEKTPAPEVPEAEKPKRTPKASTAAGKEHPDSLTTDDDRALMGEAVLPIVERDGPLLLTLAEKSFPEGLKESEKRFFRNLGIVAFSDVLPDENDATKTIRADRLAWILLDRRALRLMTPLGVMVRGANITGQLNLIQCQAGLRLQLDVCRFTQEILLQDANLTLLSLQGSHCPGLNADRLKVKRGGFLRGKAAFTGEVRLLGAEIGGVLDCSGSEFTNELKDGCALNADGLKVMGGVFLHNQAAFTGEVRLLGAEIGSNLECDGSTFTHPGGAALNADGLKVKGHVLLREGCVIRGQADFTNALVDGCLACNTLGKSTSWSLCLSHTRVGVLWDDQESWPESGKLRLDGFHYGRLFEQAEWGLAARLDWLSRHGNSGRFNPQPYEQLAAVYREAGHEADARDVLIAKNRRREDALHEEKCWWRCLGYRLHRWTSAYGYKPWWAAGWWLLLWGITWPIVAFMVKLNLLLPTLVDLHASTLRPICFTASGFSFDLLTPIFDMGYLAAWTPSNNWAALILLVLGTAGYILVALFAASITGLIRR